MQPEQVLFEPVITEKALGTKALGGYVFKVHPKATKIQVGMAVEKVFKVKVLSVNTVMVRPKTRVRGVRIGHTAHYKKAYVRLLPGQKIEELEV